MAKFPYPAIPATNNDPASLRASVDALKEHVEMMAGLRGGPRGAVNQTFIRQQGTAPPDGVRDGDILADKSSGTWAFQVWQNGKWT